MSIDRDIAFLETVPLLGLLGTDALRIIAIGAETRYMFNGDILFEEQQSADAGYVVVKGKLKLSAKSYKIPEAQAFVAKGELLSPIALVLETQYRETAAALETSTVLRITRTLFMRTLEGTPEAAVKFRDAMQYEMERTMKELERVQSQLDNLG